MAPRLDAAAVLDDALAEVGIHDVPQGGEDVGLGDGHGNQDSAGSDYGSVTARGRAASPPRLPGRRA